MSSLRPTRTRALFFLQAGLILLPALIIAAVPLAATTGPLTPNPSVLGASCKQEDALLGCWKPERSCNYLVDIAPRPCLFVSNLGNHNT
jgi:hypothetical protein